MAKNANEIEMLKKMCKELENKTIEDEQKISELHVDINNLSMNQKLHHRQAEDNHEDCKLHFLYSFCAH